MGGIASVVEMSKRALERSGRYTYKVLDRPAAQASEGGVSAGALARNVALAAALAREARRGRLVHIHAALDTPATIAKALALVLEARARGAVVLLQPHSGSVSSLEHPTSVRQRLMRQGLASLLRASTRVAIHSGFWERFFAALAPGAALSLLPNGVDTVAFSPERGERNAAAGLRIFYLGHITAYKGLDELATAWPAVYRAFPTAQLLVGGPPKGVTGGPLQERLRITPGLQLLGTLSPSEAALHYASSDIFVLPSRQESFPMSLLEAMASGCACVATDVGANAEILAGGAGVVVAPEAPDALERALTNVLGDAPLRAKMGKAARDRALHLYSESAYGEKLLALYDSML